MKFLNYIYNNSMTFWGLIWRFFVFTFVLGILGALGGYIWFIDYIGSDSMTSALKTPESAQNISKIADFFSGSNYVKYTPSEGFTTNKTGVLYKEENISVEVNLSGDANRRYESTRKGLGITNKYIYTSDNNGKNQMVPRKTVMDLFINTGSNSGISNIYVDSLFTGTDIISGDVFYIGSTNSNKLVQNINSALQNPEIYTKLKSDIGSVSIILLIPLLIALLFFMIIFTIIYIFVFLIYIFVTWIIGYFMGSIDSFAKAVSVSRIPFIIKELLQITFGLEFVISMSIYILMIIGILYWQKNNESLDIL